MSTPKKRTPVRIWQPLFLDALSRTGNVSAAADAARIDRTTAYAARKRSREFYEAWEMALDRGGDILEAEARRRAIQGTEEPVYYQGQIVGSVRKYSDTLLIFLLKAHKPAKYADNFRRLLPEE